MLATLPAACDASDLAGAAEAVHPRRVQEVYELHVDFVWRTARRLGVQDQHVDDVVQEVFLVVQRRLAEFEGRSELRTWLFGITRRVVHAHFRQNARRRQILGGDPDALADSAASSEARCATLEGVRLLHALLDELDDAKREVFVLSELEEMSGPAIAEALDLELSNVYARIRAARHAFEQVLRRHRARTERAR
jgi:RNA polymerase sigma-70 factor (ECF subfamily)